jgi:hypothetical protein
MSWKYRVQAFDASKNSGEAAPLTRCHGRTVAILRATPPSWPRSPHSDKYQVVVAWIDEGKMLASAHSDAAGAPAYDQAVSVFGGV